MKMYMAGAGPRAKVAEGPTVAGPVWSSLGSGLRHMTGHWQRSGGANGPPMSVAFQLLESDSASTDGISTLNAKS
jgi:hypothetical protein